MTSALSAFDIAQTYSNEEIFRSLGVGNTGGIRVKLNPDGSVSRVAVFTSLSTPRQQAENPYADRMEGDILVFAGTGRGGEQSLSGFNARIPEQVEQHFPIYAFVQTASRRDKKAGGKHWGFLGLLEYIRCFPEQQFDHSGTSRSAWVFEFKVHTEFQRVPTCMDREMAEALFGNWSWQLHEDRDVVETVKEPMGDTTEIDVASLERIRTSMLLCDPEKFEHTIADLLKTSGFENIEVTKYSQDGGIDINARPGWRTWPLRHLLTQIQAKRWRHSVGRKEVAELRGSLAPFATGCIVTTSHFTRAAISEAFATGKNPVAIVDGIELARIVSSLSPSLFTCFCSQMGPLAT